MIKLEDFVRPTQKQLFKRLCKKFKGKTTVSKDNFILVHGVAPVMLIAHLDTVHEEPVRQICTSDDGNILMSPQGIGGDDRCGVFALVKAYALSPVKPWLLFTCDEEVGGVGAEDFCLAYEQGQLPSELSALKFLVEIDRRGANDAVFYECENPDFEAYITGKGFVTAQGSFSDISVIAPTLDVAAVNLSSGYYNAHRLHEYIVRSELERTIQKVCEIVAESTREDVPRYEFDTRIYFSGDLRGYGEHFLWTDEAVIPADLPEEYHEIYEELLAVYPAEQLDEIRVIYGNQILWQLYRDEFGSPFFDR